MINLLIILAVVAVFYINLIFIDNIFKIVKHPNKPINITEESTFDSSKEALIYGEAAICNEIYDILYKNNISSDIFYDIDKINKSYSYKYLFAVYNDDLENLTICSIASKIMDISNIIAICNKQYNQKIYMENHISYLIKNPSASEIVLSLLSNQSSRGA